MSTPTITPTSPTEQARSTFRSVFSQLPSGVAVLTTATRNGPAGMTVSAVCSLSLDPLLALACVQSESSTLDAIVEAGRFGINVLGANAGSVSTRFAVPGPGRFAGVGYRVIDRVPVLDEAIAWLTCTVHETLPGGDHTILVGAVTGMRRTDREPLVWHGGRYRILDGTR